VVNADPVAPRLLNPAIPKDLETITLKCLEKEPSRRYQTAQELVDELKEARGSFEVLEVRAGNCNWIWWSKRRLPRQLLGRHHLGRGCRTHLRVGASRENEVEHDLFPAKP
jgi:hypothetical protein